MGVNWSAGLMRWMPHNDKTGRSFPLSHLHPFRYEVDLAAQNGHPARVVTIHVGFGLHCFTKKVEPGDCPTERYSDDREHRTFDYVRYELSKKLGNLARTLEQRHCSFAKDENFLTVDVTEQDGSIVRYGVFFNLKRWQAQGRDAVLVVIQSAYPLDPAIAEPGKGRIRFKALLGHTLRGTRPKAP